MIEISIKAPDTVFSYLLQCLGPYPGTEGYPGLLVLGKKPDSATYSGTLDRSTVNVLQRVVLV